MKAMLLLVFLFIVGWIVYFAYFMGAGELGIDDSNPIGTYDQLYERLSNTRLIKSKYDLGEGLTAYYFQDDSANKSGSFKEQAVIIADSNKKVKGVSIMYIQGTSGLYKTPVSQFLIKYWKLFSDKKEPMFETKGPNRFKTRDVAEVSKNGAKAEWITNDQQLPFSYAYFYPANEKRPALEPHKLIAKAAEDTKKDAVKKADAEKAEAKKTADKAAAKAQDSKTFERTTKTSSKTTSKTSSTKKKRSTTKKKDNGMSSKIDLSTEFSK